MSYPTHMERGGGRDPAVRGRVAPVIGHPDDDVPAVPGVRPIGNGSAPWAVGNVVAGRFVLLQRLGRGRYGPIYKALDRSLSEALIGVEHHVALHELHPRIAAQPLLLERLEQQPLHPQSWSHPNLVKLLDFGRDGARHFLSAELLEGVSLRAIIDDSASEPLAHEEALGVLRAVGAALNYAHAKGIVHGDLRPENVFVTNAYTVKVLDLLPSSERRTVAFFVEDADGDAQPHPSDDVYGLACLAYELFTGQHPYNGNSPIEALRAGLAPHPVPDLPPLRWQALSRGLALRRERRTASVPELLAGLGVTGTETLHPAAVEEARPQPAVAQPAPPPQAATWPEITDGGVEQERASRAAAAAAPPRPVRTQADWAEEPLFARAVFDNEVQTWAIRPGQPTRRSSPIRTVLGLVLLAVLAAAATIAYRDHSQLVIQAADLIETSAALATKEIAQWQARSGSAAPLPPQTSAAAPPAAAANGSAPPSVRAADTTAADTAGEAIAPQAAAPQPAAPITGEAAPAVRPAELPKVPSAAAVAAASPPQFRFAERTVTVSEGEARARIEILRTGSLDEEASVVWSVADRSALADEDYAVLGARIASFAVGQESQVVYVPLITDSVAERRETFVVNLRADRAGASAAAQLEVVVLDDDS